MHYFVRANGDTVHNNPGDCGAYVPGEPPVYPTTRYNYVHFCLEHGIARIGWPDTGDLRMSAKYGALAKAYDLATVHQRVRRYLAGFRKIAVGDVIVMPVPAKPCVHVGDVVEPYHYLHNTPTQPYECAHRVSVEWDADHEGAPVMYFAADLSIGTRGGFWVYAFQMIENANKSAEIIDNIERLRIGRPAR